MLINCPECNKEVSNQAESCPNCGFNIRSLGQGVYCPSCLYSCSKTDIDMCPYCNIKFKDSVYGTFDDVYKYCENHPELKQYPEFSQEAYNKRIGYVPVDYMSVNAVTCPYCSSTNTKKISGISKVGSVAMFGKKKQKVKKQWHCNNCNSDF